MKDFETSWSLLFKQNGVRWKRCGKEVGLKSTSTKKKKMVARSEGDLVKQSCKKNLRKSGRGKGRPGQANPKKTPDLGSQVLYKSGKEWGEGPRQRKKGLWGLNLWLMNGWGQ